LHGKVAENTLTLWESPIFMYGSVTEDRRWCT